jgi:hypothetical protein
MQQPNKGIISPGLKGLMLVQEGLRQMQEGQVSPQGPAGPTLAMQMAQAAQQPQQPQQQPSMMPPPPGQMQPEGAVANVAQDAGIGAAIQGQQQQDAQKAMMQMAMAQQQAQQQQPAMMASGGIAGLRADNMREFKEGGVLGFEDGGMPWYQRMIDSITQGQASPEAQAALANVQEAQLAKAKQKLESERATAMAAVQSPNRPQRDAALVEQLAPTAPPLAAPTVSVAQAADANNLPARPTPPPVARPPVAGSGGAAQGIQSLMTEKLPSAAVDMAAVRQQRDPEYTKTLADYKAALAGKQDFSQEGIANLAQSQREMMANREKQDKDSAYLNLQKMFAQGARSGYAGMGEANISAKEAQQALMEARANQDALLRDKMLAVRVAAQAESIGDKEKMLGAQQKVAEIDAKLADNATSMKVAEMGATSSMNNAKIAADATLRGHAMTAGATLSAQQLHAATQIRVAEMADEIKRAGLSPKEMQAQARYISAVQASEWLKSIAKRSEDKIVDDAGRAALFKEYQTEVQRLRAESGLPTASGSAPAAPAAPATDRAAADAILKGKG